MKFEVHILLKVDKDANFLEIFGDNTEVVSELIESALYDIDDVKILNCEVTNDK